MNVHVYESRPEDFFPQVEVAGIYINVGGRFLLLENAHHKSQAGGWGVPAGKLEKDENPAEAIRRELLEETGIAIASEASLRLLGQMYIRKPEIDYVFHLFSVDLDEFPKVQLSLEHAGYKWVLPQEAECLPLVGAGKEALDAYSRLSQKKVRHGVSLNAYLLLRRGDEGLLHLRKNTGYCDDLYGLVSGHVEDGESAIAAMIREAYEEAGIQIEPHSLKAIYVMHRQTNRFNIDIFFECHEWQGSILNREADKCAALDFFPLKALPSNMIPYIRFALEDIAKGNFYSESGWK